MSGHGVKPQGQCQRTGGTSHLLAGAEVTGFVHCPCPLGPAVPLPGHSDQGLPPAIPYPHRIPTGGTSLRAGFKLVPPVALATPAGRLGYASGDGAFECPARLGYPPAPEKRRGASLPAAKPKLLLQLFRGGQQLGHAGQEAAGGAAVEDTMIEAECKIRFHDRDKLALGGVPARHRPRGAHAQHQGLLR